LNRLPAAVVNAPAAAGVLLAGFVLAACGGSPEAVPPAAAGAEGTPAPRGAPRASGAPRAASDNPLDLYIDKAGAYLASTQAEDGSWPYFHSRKPDFVEPEPHANLFGTMITLMNLTHTGFEASSTFKRGADHVRGRMTKGFAWALYEPGALGDASWFEPDADGTAVALTLLAGRLRLAPVELKEVRARFDRHRTSDGLYLTYFDGFHPEKGFVPDPNVVSIGVNLNVLGFFGKYELPRASLVQGLQSLTQVERYWEKTPFYRSLPVLAYLASNAVEHGAPEAGELLRRFLADFAAGPGQDEEFASRLHTVDLAAFIKARAHACLLELSPCRDLDLKVFQLAKRRQMDGSWETAPFYEYDINPRALEAFLARRDFAVRRKRGGYGYDAERALASPGTVRYYDGSPAETTSFALKALVFYRELLDRRPAMGPAPQGPSSPPRTSPAPS
jgi:hypothetical protein